MHVAAVGVEVDDRITDDLAGAVVGHVAAAARFVDPDAEPRQLLVAGDDVGAAAVALDAERDHRRMLEQQQGVGHLAGPPLLDERLLHGEALRVVDDAEAMHDQRLHQSSLAAVLRRTSRRSSRSGP
jgi:hypothetical protein